MSKKNTDTDALCPDPDILNQLETWMNEDHEDDKANEKIKKVNQEFCIRLLENLETVVYNKKSFSNNVCNLLIEACNNGLSKLALYIIRKKKTNLEGVDSNNSTALFWACLNGLKDVVQELLINGCSIEHINKKGDTALHYAADQYNFTIILILIEHSLKTEKKLNELQVNDDGDTVLDLLLSKDCLNYISNAEYIECVNWLINRYQDIDPANESLLRSIEFICANPKLKAKIKVNCTRPRIAEAVVAVQQGIRLGSPKTRAQKHAIGSKRTTAKKSKTAAPAAKAIPLALAVREPGEDTGFNVDWSDDEGERVSPPRR